MTGATRRTVLGGAVLAGVAGLVGAIEAEPFGPDRRPVATTWTTTGRWGATVAEENRLPGSAGWSAGPPSRTVAARDTHRQIQVYASATSAARGDTIAFHVSAVPAARCTAEIYRLGWYGGAGGRLMAVSGDFPASVQPIPSPDATGLVACDWPASAALTVPSGWPSGLYVAAFTTPTGYRTATPFVVRDEAARADLCVVVPFATYQAYNLWPHDMRTGKSLYRGYVGDVAQEYARARRVSFDRPYADGGLPGQIVFDIDFIAWAERLGYDMTYATSLDLHGGRIAPAHHRGLVFSGHEEYFSTPMRAAVTRAAGLGRDLAFMSANNMYWHIRVGGSAAGVPERVIDCYRTAEDPVKDPDAMTVRWRDLGHHHQLTEQQVLGVQYVAIVGRDAPLVVANPGHWLWSGTGVRPGDPIPHLVGGEADNLSRLCPGPVGGSHTLLSDSPFRTAAGRPAAQQTSLWERPDGGLTFTAGTFRWTRALSAPGFVDARIQRAARNLLDQMVT